ncbi:MAG: oligosaccharide flippase family protein [Deltaproteobacteria bacterium]|nr:oligosaccharide flippase family protein [Deltaproteobacteria bacterium]
MLLPTRIVEFVETRFPAMSLQARVARGTFWTLVGSLTAQGTGLLGSILCARILGSVGFGELGMVRSTVLMFGVLAGTGLGLAATKYVAEFRTADPPKAGRMIGLLLNSALLLGGVVTLVCLIGAAPLARWVLKAPHLSGALQMGCFLLLLNTLNGVQLGAVCGFEAFRTQSRVIILDGMFTLILMPAGAWVSGVTGAVGGLVLASLLGFVIKQKAMHQECEQAVIPVSYRWISQEFPALWRFVLPAVLVGVSIQPFEWLSRLLLVRQPNGYAELGVFTAVYTWVQLIVFLPGQISAPTMPILSNLLAGGKTARLKHFIFSSQVLVFSLAVLTALPLVLLSPYMLRAYGSEFIAGRASLLVMTAALVIGAATMITRAFFAASDRMWWQVGHTTAWGFFLIVGCVFFIRYGGLGLSFSYLIAYSWLAFIQFGTQALVLKKISRKYA